MLKIISILTISDSMLDAPTFFIQNSSDLQDIQIHETCSCLRNCWFTWTPRPLMGGRSLDKRRRRKVKILIVINEPVMRWGKGVLPTREFQRERQFDIYKFLSQQKLRLSAKTIYSFLQLGHSTYFLLKASFLVIKFCNLVVLVFHECCAGLFLLLLQFCLTPVVPFFSLNW